MTGAAPTAEDATRMAAPLLDVFHELRRRNFPLGVTDYIAALRALEAGFGMSLPGEHRAGITFLCQALWAKSVDERQQVADAVEAALPDRPTAEELKRLDEALARLEGGAEAGDERAVPTRTPGDPAAARDVGRTPLPDDAPPASGADRPPATGDATGPGPGLDALAETIAVPLPIRSPGLASFQLDPHFDLVGTLPVTHRQMSRAWRFYRRMARMGPRTELDAEATLERMARNGVLGEPVFVPRRTNQARALILVDAGGSMTPFRYVTEELLRAAKQAGLSRVDIRYFHDAPRLTVHADEDFTEPIAIEAAASPFVDAGVLVYSDAGAARGGLDPVRVEDSRTLIETLRRFTPAIAWLNPVPRSRWNGTTAQAIRESAGIAMLPLDRRGVNAAVDVMRGLVR